MVERRRLDERRRSTTRLRAAHSDGSRGGELRGKWTTARQAGHADGHPRNQGRTRVRDPSSHMRHGKLKRNRGQPELYEGHSVAAYPRPGAESTPVAAAPRASNGSQLQAGAWYVATAPRPPSSAAPPTSRSRATAESTSLA